MRREKSDALYSLNWTGRGAQINNHVQAMGGINLQCNARVKDSYIFSILLAPNALKVRSGEDIIQLLAACHWMVVSFPATMSIFPVVVLVRTAFRLALSSRPATANEQAIECLFRGIIYSRFLHPCLQLRFENMGSLDSESS